MDRSKEARDVMIVAEEKIRLFSLLTVFGSHYSLLPNVSERELEAELSVFESDWKPYNPNKPNNKRFGLSLTSLDGKLSGIPDLTSLLEFNQRNGTNYQEMSFTTLTPVYEKCPSLHEFINPFLPYLGRTHFLRFEAGGFFPYHRDFHPNMDSFRIFIPLHTHSSKDFVFLLGPQRISLEKGHPYFINTLEEHALFVFDGPSTHLVMNVRLCPEAVALVQSKMSSY